MRFPTEQFIRYGNVGLGLVMVLVFAGLCWFLFANVYVPLTRAAVVVELKQTVALVTVNQAAIDSLLSDISKTKEPLAVDWHNLRNIFRPVTPLTPEEPQTTDATPLPESGPTTPESN